MRKPNILFLFTDQHRWDALGCSGGWVRTPNLDGIAAVGVLFSNCVTNAPVCVPARMSLVTGWYPHNTGVWLNSRITLPLSAPTWIRALRECGYHTSLFGKTHLHSKRRMDPRGPSDLRKRENLLHTYGFDDVNEAPGPQAACRVICHMTAEWRRKGLLEAFRKDMRARLASRQPIVRPSPLGLDDYYDVYVGRKAATYLRQYSDAKPWFCWVGFPGPHAPYDTPEPYASMYRAEAMPPPVPFSESMPRDLRRRPAGWLDKKLSAEGGRVSPELAKKLRANYAGSVTLIDALVGEIIGEIQARGELDETVIIVASDHGEMNGDFGLLNKSNMLDGAVRVPLLVLTPNIFGTQIRSRVCDEPVELFDIGPTLVELGGGSLPHQQFGRSLVPVLANPAQHHRSDAMVEHRHEVMICNQLWKMALNAQGEPYLLFDRKQDPHECHNLAGRTEYHFVEREMRARIRSRIRESQLNPVQSGRLVSA